VLLQPHRSYLGLVGPVLADADETINGMAHITGGGLTDNLPRVLPAGTAAEIDRATWTPSSVFSFLQDHGALTDAEAFRTFNMGIGMVVVCDAEAANGLLSRFRQDGKTAAVEIGSVTSGDGTVRYV
jgi:phosphoribosylformylglycinamidine cyclo-ligase